MARPTAVGHSKRQVTHWYRIVRAIRSARPSSMQFESCCFELLTRGDKTPDELFSEAVTSDVAGKMLTMRAFARNPQS